MFFYELNISYDGTNFFGSAKQKKYRTIEGELLRCINKVLENKVNQLVFAGRTDKTVHAINQVVSFSIETKIKFSKVKFIDILNKILPSDIKVVNFKRHINFFNARYDAKQREYEFLIQLPPHDIFKRNYVLQYDKNISFALFKRFRNIFIGEHDFLSFSTSEKLNTIRTIYKISLKKIDNLLKITIVANGFLRSQIRMMIAGLLRYNDKKISLAELNNLLQNPKKGSSHYKVSGSGLYFKNAKY